MGLFFAPWGKRSNAPMKQTDIIFTKIQNKMQTPKIINLFFIGFYLCFCTIACDVATTEPQYIPDVQGLEQEVQIIRFEQALFNLDTNNMAQSLESLYQKYPKFTPGFMQTVFRVNDRQVAQRAVKGYLNYPPAQHTYDTIQQLFGDLSPIQPQLNQLATYFAYYNYNDQTPITKAYTHLCEYSYDRAVGDGFIPLPLDMAIGQGYPPYTQAQIPMYQQRTLNLQHLVPKAAYAIAEDWITNAAEMKGNYMIDFMLLEGKKYYLTDILMPKTADSLKFGFSAFQMKYCQRGELELYEHLSDNEMLYSNNRRDFSKFITPGPFNPAISLPGNSGSWLGYRIVESFAKKQREVLQQSQPNLSAREIDQKVLQIVLKENDPQKYLQLYKPKK